MDLLEIEKNLQNDYNFSKISAEKQAFFNKSLAEKNLNYVNLCKIERDLIFLIGKEKAKNNPDENVINDCYSQLSITSKNKLKILANIGLTPNDLLPKYSCNKCKDTGIIDGHYCNCFKKRRNEEIINEYGLTKDELVSFDEINENLFKNETDLQNFKKLKNILQKWCESYPKIQKFNIFLLGSVGVGKTFLLKCMAKYLLEKQYLVCFTSAFEMNTTFLNYHTAPIDKKQNYLTPFLESDILFIDDLGIEPLIKNVTENYLTSILSERDRLKKPTIISTNISIENIISRYGDRNFSRLTNKQTSAIFSIIGEDLRTSK